MFLPLSLSAPPPLASSAPGAESNYGGGAEKKFVPFGRDSAPPEFFLAPQIFFSAPAKINPGHATE